MVHDKVSGFDLEQVLNQGPFESFSNCVVTFLHEVSASLFLDQAAKQFPDLISFAFFIRKSNLNKLRHDCIHDDRYQYVGIGLALHIAPANVPLNFAYSLISSLLSGNPSVVRISSRNFQQANLLIDHFNMALNNRKLPPIFSIILYSHDSPLNSFLSKSARCRLIWGGNETIGFFKKFEVQPNVVDLTFPNKYSLALIDANFYLKEENFSKVADDFYNDVYTFDQNGCTSPRAVVWIGDEREVANAKDIFWRSLKAVIDVRKYSTSLSCGINHFVFTCRVAAGGGAQIDPISQPGKFSVLTLKKIKPEFFRDHPGEGLFLELRIESLNDLHDLIDDQCQTLTVLGKLSRKITHWIKTENISGIDRISKFGDASSFSLYWDGKDLFQMQTRKLSNENY